MVKIYVADVAALEEETTYRRYYESLSPQRQAKADKIKPRSGKLLCVGAGAVLNMLLRERGLRERDMEYVFGPNGKPCFAGAPQVHFNLSHAGSRVMAAVADCEVGCDIEPVREIEEKLARRFFSESECAYIDALPESEKTAGFFRVWTLRESFVKATGAGLAGAGGLSLRFEGGRVTANGGRFYFYEKDLPAGYKCAVCTPEAVEPDWMIVKL